MPSLPKWYGVMPRFWTGELTFHLLVVPALSGFVSGLQQRVALNTDGNSSAVHRAL